MSEDNQPEEKKVTHKFLVDRTPEIDSLHDENAILKHKLEEASLYEVSRQKQELIDKYGEYKDEIEDLKTPEEMDKFKLRVFNDKAKEKPKTHAPYGKSSIIPPKGEMEYSSQAEMVDSLYDKAYYSSQKYTPEEVSEAKAKIEQLLRSMIGGTAWKEMRERNSTNAIEKHKLSACPKCHFTLVDTNKCSNCGYDATEKQKVRD
jgi:hypothetical protein